MFPPAQDVVFVGGSPVRDPVFVAATSWFRWLHERGSDRETVAQWNKCNWMLCILHLGVLKLLKLWTLNPAIKLWIQAQPIRHPVTAPSTTPNHVHKLYFEPRHTKVVCCKEKVHQFQACRRGKDQAPSRLQKAPCSVPEPRGKRENYVIALSHEWFNSSHWLRFLSLLYFQTTWGTNEDML